MVTPTELRQAANNNGLELPNPSKMPVPVYGAESDCLTLRAILASLEQIEEGA